MTINLMKLRRCPTIDPYRRKRLGNVAVLKTLTIIRPETLVHRAGFRRYWPALIVPVGNPIQLAKRRESVEARA
jgi:hypothetical protein